VRHLRIIGEEKKKKKKKKKPQGKNIMTCPSHNKGIVGETERMMLTAAAAAAGKPSATGHSLIRTLTTVVDH